MSLSIEFRDSRIVYSEIRILVGANVPSITNIPISVIGKKF